MLIAAAGLAGSGKTTSLEHLTAIGAGSYVYVGGIVRAEVAARGLDPTAEAERLVREALRQEGGRAALAHRAAPLLAEKLAAGETVMIDAICNMEEAEFYRATFRDKLIVLALNTAFEVRAARLATRPDRPIDADALVRRDRYEIEKLHIDRVLALADVHLNNGRSLGELYGRLDTYAAAGFLGARPDQLC